MLLFKWVLLLPTAMAGECGYNAAPPPDAGCLAGPWFFPPNPTYRINFNISESSADAVAYNISASGGCPWTSATATFLRGASSFSITFDEQPPLTMPGFPDVSSIPRPPLPTAP
jgi:hypothetical protein